MTTGHLGSLYIDGRSPLHRMRPQTKLAAHLAFVLAVVLTPREAFWAFGLHAAILVSIVVLSGIGARLALKRMTLELPFVAFAFLLPLLGGGERTPFLWGSLSVEGLWGGWNILAKATLGMLASVVLASTTTASDILKGLERLRVPSAFVVVAGFMVRYVDVVAGELSRMRVARASRACDGRWLWQAGGVAAMAGSLFIRSYERGERVFLAMRSRGYDGNMPAMATETAGRAETLCAAGVALAAGLVTTSAWMMIA